MPLFPQAWASVGSVTLSWHCPVSEDSLAEEEQLEPLATTNWGAHSGCLVVTLGHVQHAAQLQLTAGITSLSLDPLFLRK